PNLAKVLDPVALGPLLSEALGQTIVNCRPNVLRYRPGTRATIAISAQVRHGIGARRIRLIAKLYGQGHKASAVFDESRKLFSVTLGDGLVLAEPLAYLPALPMILQAPVTGVPLDQLVASALSARPDPRVNLGLHEAAKAMAALHRLPPVSSRQRRPEKELVRFVERATRIALVDPAVGRRLLAVIALLASQFGQLPSVSSGLVHGDCKPSQFLTRPTGVALLDFDHCGIADPAGDVGAFTAALRKAAVVSSQTGRSYQLEREFLETYLNHAANQEALAARANWHQAASLVRKALRAFARAPRSPLAEALAGEAERVLVSGPRG
ncbi:MAG: phosphotransferase family protein, partial [Pseudonocardiaceae bacterium]